MPVTIRSFQSGFKMWSASTDTVVGGRIAPGDKARTVCRLRRAASTGYAHLRVLMVFLGSAWGGLVRSVAAWRPPVEVLL